MRKGEDLEGYNWRNYKVKGWPYSSDAPQNKKWQHDRAKLFREGGNVMPIKKQMELFREGGNGWWRLKGTPEYSKHLERIKNEMP